MILLGKRARNLKNRGYRVTEGYGGFFFLFFPLDFPDPEKGYEGYEGYERNSSFFNAFNLDHLA